MSAPCARWDTLTYDGSAPGRAVPTLHVFLKPLDREGPVLETAQRLFQDLISRFYSGPPFLAPEEKLADTIRYAREEAARTGGAVHLERIRLAAAIVDRGSGEVYVHRSGDVRLYRPGLDDEPVEGNGSERIPLEGLGGLAILDGDDAEAIAGAVDDGGAANDCGRLIHEGRTGGVWIPLAGTGETFRPAATVRTERPSDCPAGESSAAEPPARAARRERGDRRGGLSLLPLGLILLLFLVAVFWNRRGEEGSPARRDAAISPDDLVPGPSPAGTLIWQFSAGAAVTSSPRIEGERVFIGSRDGNLYALDRNDGRRIWTAKGPGGVGSSPAAADGKIFFGEYGGALVAVSAETGGEIWRLPTGAKIVSSPAVREGIVYVGSFNRKLYAVDAETGETSWTFATGGAIWSSPRIAGDRVLFGSLDGILYAVNAETGAEAWRFDAGARIYAPPALGKERVFIGAQDGRFHSLSASTGAPFWTVDTGSPVQSGAAVAGDRVVFGCEDGTILALYRETGETLWSFPTGGRVPSTPVIRGDMVYAASYDRFLYALDLELGHPVWRVDLGAAVYSSPAADDRAIILGSNGGRVAAVAIGR